MSFFNKKNHGQNEVDSGVERICRNCNKADLMVFCKDDYVCRADRYMRCYSGDHVCHRGDDFIVRRNCTRKSYVAE